MVELYTIQRYLQYNTLVKNNLQHFDSWASTFGETVTAVELTPEGTGYSCLLYTSSGIAVDEYAVTDKNGVASFDDVLISGTTPYTIEEVDTCLLYTSRCV